MKTVTAEEMREIDRRTIEEFGIPGIILMEHAGRAVSDTAEEFVKPEAGTIVILCGSGNNGGDGLAAARHLYNHGYGVEVILIKPPENFKGDALVNYEIAKKLQIRLTTPFSGQPLPPRTSFVIDAMLGTGTRGEITGSFRQAIELINASGKPVLAVDLPSGIDADTGKVLGAAVNATVTVTMGLMKKGLLAPEAKLLCGDLRVADIGLPRQLLR